MTAEPAEQPQLIETTALSFTGLNGEYPLGVGFELGEPVRYTVTGYVRKTGNELLEPGNEDEAPRTRAYAQLKITGIKRTS